MTNQIEPYSMIQKTNIKEHNDMVNKINEIVGVINNVNLETINAEISGLKAKASATDTEIANIKNKDSMQDTEIDGIDKSLISDVTATFDNPSRELKISVGKKDSTSIDTTVVIPSSSETGQYSAGNGITIENYQIAVDTNVVALKTDIPVVPDVSGINNRLDTIDGEITGINANITNLTNKNTEQDTAINGKVAIAQGVENAGKVLGIGVDGNVTPVNGSSGVEVWEEVDLNNFPTDWVKDDKFKISFKVDFDRSSPFIKEDTFNRPSKIIELIMPTLTITGSALSIIKFNASNNYMCLSLYEPPNFNSNDNSKWLFRLSVNFGGQSGSLDITKSNLSTYVYKIWRCRAST